MDLSAKVVRKCAVLEIEKDSLRHEVDFLLTRCREIKEESNLFNEADLKVMINLCHPDKHSGKRSATEMTQKLLEMRGKS
jgi:hypothetical protein